MKYTLRIFFLILISITTLHARQSKEIVNDFQKYADEFGGRVGVAAKNVSTGETILFQADSLFPTASIIKLPVLTELFFKFHDGTLDPQKPVMLVDSVKKPGSGILQFLGGNQTLRLMDIATLMIILSDNTATNYVIDQFGTQHDQKLEEVNSRMRSLGLQHTKLLNKVYSFATKKKTPEAQRFGLGVTSPSDMMMLLEKIVKGEIINKAVSDSMIAIMKNQQDNLMAQRLLPFDSDTTLWIANKTGSVDASKNDIGIVSSSRGMYIYAILCSDSKDIGEQVDNKATLAIAKISRRLYDRWLAH